MNTIAFIGLGVMGKLMVARLEKTYRIRSYDLNGKGSCKSTREAAWGADAMITMLPDGHAVREAVFDALPSLRPGALVIDMSSSDPAGTRALGTALARNKVEMLDAPVSGARFKAKDGTLAIMVGGEKKAFRKALPALSRLGTEIFYVGPLGAGHAVKALNNYLGAAGTLAGFEALLIAQKFGLDPKPMLEAINASTGRNSTTVRKIPQDVLTGAFASGFKLALMTKDVGIAAELARGLKVKTPFLKALGFTKRGQAFLRRLPQYTEFVQLEAGSHNMSPGPWRFGITIGAHFDDIKPPPGSQATRGRAHAVGTIRGLIPNLPHTFEVNLGDIPGQAQDLVELISNALSRLPEFVDTARANAIEGRRTLIDGRTARR